CAREWDGVADCW
nr:immunoglobulin heavy chain junction region [Mus musculus]